MRIISAILACCLCSCGVTYVRTAGGYVITSGDMGTYVSNGTTSDAASLVNVTGNVGSERGLVRVERERPGFIRLPDGTEIFGVDHSPHTYEGGRAAARILRVDRAAHVGSKLIDRSASVATEALNQ